MDQGASLRGALLRRLQGLRDPAVVMRYFTSIARSGSGNGTVWKLRLATGFGQTYKFEIDFMGRITRMWNTTARDDAAMAPLRQFYRQGPVGMPPPLSKSAQKHDDAESCPNCSCFIAT